MFITIEGMDGSGKSTQILKLQEYLTLKGIDFITTKEPGGTDVGKEIRKLLLEGKKDIDPLSEAMLFFADRRLHVEQVIKPALESGKVVISDRFADSTYAFQKAAGGISYDVFKNLYDLSIGDFKPDLTLYFDLDAETGLNRSLNNTDWNNTETRMESKGVAYHEKVRSGFLELAEKEPYRVVVIDKNKTAEQTSTVEEDIQLTHSIVKGYVDTHLSDK